MNENVNPSEFEVISGTNRVNQTVIIDRTGAPERVSSFYGNASHLNQS